MKDKVVGVVTLRNVAKMTKKQRRAIADWLINQGISLDNDGELYVPLYRARFYHHTK